ncbi:ABC transporter permease [Starkeya sp. 3C]|uniref:ABC transporter permease n=2 Tax=Ancylobacter moscoviensis TaxID=2597768 RepID=A0ABY3DXD7_9HYPH|nr:ABC transporter permease [Ancylobacter moscoviensis]
MRPQMSFAGFRAIGRWWLLLALIASLLAFAAGRPQMLDSGNIVTILRSASIMAIMVLGLTWVIAAGKIDVSFMQIAALANMTTAGLLAQGSGWALAALCGIAIGAVVGLVNGVLVGRMRLSPLITTIATGGVCASAAAAIGAGTSIRIDDTGLLGDFLAARLGPVPLIALFVAVLYAVAWWMQERLTFGHYIYAAEQNEEALVDVGVPVHRLLVLVYLISGVCASVAGVLLAASLSSGQPMIGSSYFIDGLTAVFLGGMMIRIGRPNVIGTATAVLLLAVLVSGGALLGWPDYQREIIKGALLLAGVAMAVRMGRALDGFAKGGRS